MQNINSFLKFIKEKDFTYNSIIQINTLALNEAEKLDNYFKKNKKLKGRLHGIPVLIKDNIKTKDYLATSCGSIIFKDFYSDENAQIVDWLLSEGAVILGKTNMCEFSNYVSNASNSGFSSLGGQTYSIYGSNYEVGGSSSGSAVAVAASLCIFSIGTETDGSVVYPAAQNGVFAFKFCSDQISSKGIIGISSYFDAIGFFTKKLDDLKYIIDLLTNKSIFNNTTKRVFIEKSSFQNILGSEKLYGLIIDFLDNFKIDYKTGTFIENMEPYFEMIDIVCQAEFKSNFLKHFYIESEDFLEKCRECLLGDYYTDINEIERSFASDFISDGSYVYSISELNLLKKSKYNYLQQEEMDLVIALTLGPNEVASIANMAGFTHLVVPLDFLGEFSLAFSILGRPGNEDKSFIFAESFILYLKNKNL